MPPNSPFQHTQHRVRITKNVLAISAGEQKSDNSHVLLLKIMLMGFLSTTSPSSRTSSCARELFQQYTPVVLQQYTPVVFQQYCTQLLFCLEQTGLRHGQNEIFCVLGIYYFIFTYMYTKITRFYCIVLKLSLLHLFILFFVNFFVFCFVLE